MATAVHATAEEVDAVVDVVAAAFRDDPVMRWAFEPAADTGAGIDALMGVLVPCYWRLGHTYVVHGTAGVVGAGLWAPPGRRALGDDDLPRFIEVLGPILGDQLGSRFSELSRVEQYFPAEPHLYLGILAVHPDARNRGHGGSLLAPLLAECDRMGLLAHLESSNPRNISLYERHGFVVTDAYDVGGPGGPVMTIMSRPPRS